MSKRLDVLTAVKALVGGAVPAATVLGLDGTEDAPISVPAGGLIVIRAGDPGEPTVDLSPLTYNYDHQIPIEVSANASANLTSEQATDAIMVEIGMAIGADRSLGGLCMWLDATSAQTQDVYVEGARPPRGGDFMIVASYATTNPLN